MNYAISIFTPLANNEITKTICIYELRTNSVKRIVFQEVKSDMLCKATTAIIFIPVNMITVKLICNNSVDIAIVIKIF